MCVWAGVECVWVCVCLSTHTHILYIVTNENIWNICDHLLIIYSTSYFEIYNLKNYDLNSKMLFLSFSINFHQFENKDLLMYPHT